MKAFEYSMQGNALNTMNGQKVRCKIVTTSREKAFQIFGNIFPSSRPSQILEESEVKA